AGATMYIRELVAQTEQKSAKRNRGLVGVFATILVVVAAGAFYFFQSQSREVLEQQRQVLQASMSASDSARAELARLQEQVAQASASSMPSPLLDSLRVELAAAAQRTQALEDALGRAQESMNNQIARADSARRAERARLSALQRQLRQASSRSQTSQDDLAALRQQIQQQESRVTQMDDRLRAVRGVDLAGIAEANQAAIGFIESYYGRASYVGTGFVFTPNGYLATNRHNVMRNGRRADSVIVTMADDVLRDAQRARIVRTTSESGPDVAILRILNYSGPHITNLDWQGEQVRSGESAAVIGFPGGLDLSVDDEGYVRTSITAGRFRQVGNREIQYEAFTVTGNSGSPVFNGAGQVVAIHFGAFGTTSDQDEVTSIGLAVPLLSLVQIMPGGLRSSLGLQ
ncbi:MAG: trypsin-like peptidase domain-containing protein, partial [Gemmatimonadales bacterium]